MSSSFLRRRLIRVLLVMAAGASRLLGVPVDLMERIPLVPYPQKLVYRGEKVPFPRDISVQGLEGRNPGEARTMETLQALFRLMPDVKADFGGGFPYKITFEKDARITQPEGYALTSDATGVTVRFGTEAGEFYGAQTAYQLLAYAYHGTQFLLFDQRPAEVQRCLPVLSIEDAPAYAIRSSMADLGRAPFSPALLKRLIRIMGQLKLNTLHLRLYDDELCGFRFAHLPLGQENPHALAADDLVEIVRYARTYHIAVIPELESWGHVQSIIYHYPQLRGGPGMTGGSSFGIGEPTYALLEKIYEEIIACLDDTAAVHVGLDEAVWAALPGTENQGGSPAALVGRIHQILMRVAARQHKQITMHLWADHGGRPLPKELEGKVVIEPWAYVETNGPDIINKLKQYGGAGKTPLMMGAGNGWGQVHGDYEATRIWCIEGRKYPNVLGVTLCLWGSNDLAGRLVTLYGGAGFAWNPNQPQRAPNDPCGELLRARIDADMRNWQVIFSDADPGAIDADRGPEAGLGRYLWPPRARQAVAPTVDFVPPGAGSSGPAR